MNLGRYQHNLLHWKTLEALNKTKCHTGDSYSSSHTRLGMDIRYKEYKLKQLEEKKDKTNEEQDSIEKLSCELKELNYKYETEKARLNARSNYEMLPDHTLIHCQLISDDGKNI